MSRPNSQHWLMVPVLLLAVIAVACGGGEEKTLLNKYFMASKMSDNMTLSNIATVAFDPKTDGQMQSFSIVKVSEPVVTPLEIKQHAAELKAASDEEKAFTDKKKVFQDANGDAIDRILKAEQKNQTAEGQGRRTPEGMDQVARGARRSTPRRCPRPARRSPPSSRSSRSAARISASRLTRRPTRASPRPRKSPSRATSRPDAGTVAKKLRVHAAAHRPEGRQRQGHGRTLGDHGPEGRASRKKLEVVSSSSQ